MTDETGSDVARRCADGQAALRRGAWSEAATIFESMLAVDESADALEGYTLARWWQDDVTSAIELRERAYALRRGAGQTIEASLDAALLAGDHGAMRGADAVAQGWLLRARQLTEEVPPTGASAWLSLIEASFHIDTDAGEVLRLGTEAEDLARRHGALDVAMTERTLRGLALVTVGRRREGMALLDEGVAAASSGELHDPFAIGSCHCNMIIACERARDLNRLAQWVGRLVFQPGWRWSDHVKPIAGTDSCQAPHFQYHVSGRLGILMDDGTELEAGPGDVTRLSAGHDGWVIGDEPAVVIDWYGASTYARDGG